MNTAKPTPIPWVLRDDGQGWPMLGVPSGDPNYKLLDLIVCHTADACNNGDEPWQQQPWLKRAQAQAWANARLIMAGVNSLAEPQKIIQQEQGELFT